MPKLTTGPNYLVRTDGLTLIVEKLSFKKNWDSMEKHNYFGILDSVI